VREVIRRQVWSILRQIDLVDEPDPPSLSKPWRKAPGLRLVPPVNDPRNRG